MDKEQVIEMMHGHGFFENFEEIFQHGEVKFQVSWTRISDKFRGPVVVSESANDAFVESAQQTLGAITITEWQKP